MVKINASREILGSRCVFYLLLLISFRMSCFILDLLSPKINKRIAPQKGFKIQNKIVQPTTLRPRFLAIL